MRAKLASVSSNPKGDAVVFQPTRGDGALRLGPSVRQIPDVGGSTLPADVYRDPARFELEREKVLRYSWLVAGRSDEIPNRGDWLLYEGHGETVVATRQADGGVAAFHNVCQHRGSRLTRGEERGCLRRFVCPWHGWVYDTTGALVGVPDREDFDPAHLEGVRAPRVAAEEWAGWVWIFLAGPDAAPPLLDWIGPDIAEDLGRFRMEKMYVHDKLVVDVPANYKAIVDGFNEVYHATELHGVGPDFTKAARGAAFHLSGPNSMMFVPRTQWLDRLRETWDHHAYTISHYVVFPNTVFNNNPTDIQLFQPIPMSVDRTKFICWELIYKPDGPDDPDYDDYITKATLHWDVLKGVVAEDLFVFGELDATRHSMAYRQNTFSSRECKPTMYHRTMDAMLQGQNPLDEFKTKHPG
jgi:phenylpropionate dioxygenase-like ring-hydroxylating dioxygenase large terminal subunit